MKLMVGNLPADCEEKALHAVFAEHGECIVVLQPSPDGQDLKAVVTYDNESCAKTAVSHLHHTQFGGKEVVVEEVAETPASSPPKPAAASRSRSRSRSPEAHVTPSKPIESPKIKTPGSTAGNHEPQGQPSSSKKPKAEAPEPQGSSHSTPAKKVEAPSEEPPAAEEPAATTSSEPKTDEKPKKNQGEKQDFAVEEDGSKFKILSTNKRNDELSSWKCLACNRKIQKKSVKAHIASKTHKQHIS